MMRQFELVERVTSYDPGADEDMLNRAWADAVKRGDKMPPLAQKSIPPTVPGQQ